MESWELEESGAQGSKKSGVDIILPQIFPQEDTSKEEDCDKGVEHLKSVVMYGSGVCRGGRMLEWNIWTWLRAVVVRGREAA